MDENEVEKVRYTLEATYRQGVSDKLERLEERINSAEIKIYDLDMKVTKVTEQHLSLERLMSAELRRVGDRVEQIAASIGRMADKINELSEKRNGDLRTVLGVTWAILVSILGAIAWMVFNHVVAGGP